MSLLHFCQSVHYIYNFNECITRIIIFVLVLCRLSPAIENLSPWLKIGDNRLKLFTIDCWNSVMVPSFSVTFGSFAVG